MVVMSQNGGTPETVLPDYWENTRLYSGFQRGKYLLPCDEEEKDRLDMFHKLFWVARRERHHDVPIPERAKILDVGTGTGIWAIDVAEANPTAQVMGVDISWIQPPTIPSNVSFHRADVELPWPSHFAPDLDVVHIRTLGGAIRQWNAIYTQAFSHLKPGGYLEHVEIEFVPRCDDNTLPPDSPLHAWSRDLHHAFYVHNQRLDIDPLTTDHLRHVGFTDVKQTVIKLPLNPWPTDKLERETGRWFNLSMTHGFQAISLAALTRVERWPKQQVDKLVDELKKEICKLPVHAYCKLYVWTAKKPGQ